MGNSCGLESRANRLPSTSGEPADSRSRHSVRLVQCTISSDGQPIGANGTELSRAAEGGIDWSEMLGGYLLSFECLYIIEQHESCARNIPLV